MVFLASGSQPTAAARAKGSHVATPAAILPQREVVEEACPLQGGWVKRAGKELVGVCQDPHSVTPWPALRGEVGIHF